MSGSARWLLMAAAGLLMTGVAACGTSSAPPGAGNSSSISMSLNTVPTVRSVTVSPSKALFRDCTGGSAAGNTKSTAGKLGYPNGRCWFGKIGPGGQYPITITNTGIASDIDVSGSSANPSDDGDQWSLCNIGKKAAVTCTANSQHMDPGTNQYRVINFSADNRPNFDGLTDSPTCDSQFRPTGGCFATQGQFQNEGLELIGPSESSDLSTTWTVTITWMPVPK